jgi:divalent metal cation (Fe/Co/Zn/Cd) transporter
MESGLTAADRSDALRLGIRLELITIVWMLVECAVSIGAGVAARSVLLTAFGFDSVIELISAVVLLWRLRTEERGGDVERVEQVETRATWMSAILLALLCVYVVFTAVIGLLARVEPESSPVGICVALAAVLIMPLLARSKRNVNVRLQSAALHADIAESITCAYMAATVLGGLVANALLGVWWIEYLAALALLFWLVGETREAFEAAHGEG